LKKIVNIYSLNQKKNSYNGYYTVAKYPLSQNEIGGDTLVIYDFRDKTNQSKISNPCKQTTLPEMKGLVVLGYFYISDKEIKWVQEIPKSQTQTPSQYRINSLCNTSNENDYKVNLQFLFPSN